MEVYMFMITIGMLIAIGLIGLGVCLGEYVAEDRKGNTKGSRGGRDYRAVLPGGDTDVRVSYLGNSNGKEHSRCSVGSSREITGEEMILVLNNFRLMASNYETEVIDAIVEKIEDEIEY